jgi:ABC-type spermidine/putrescine transport system permease subunit II
MITNSSGHTALESGRSIRIGLWAQVWESSECSRWVDIIIYSLILGFGALLFFVPSGRMISSATMCSGQIPAAQLLSTVFMASMAIPKRICHRDYRCSLPYCTLREAAVMWFSSGDGGLWDSRLSG